VAAFDAPKRKAGWVREEKKNNCCPAVPGGKLASPRLRIGKGERALGGGGGKKRRRTLEGKRDPFVSRMKGTFPPSRGKETGKLIRG